MFVKGSLYDINCLKQWITNHRLYLGSAFFSLVYMYTYMHMHMHLYDYAAYMQFAMIMFYCESHHPNAHSHIQTLTHTHTHTCHMMYRPHSRSSTGVGEFFFKSERSVEITHAIETVVGAMAKDKKSTKTSKV